MIIEPPILDISLYECSTQCSLTFIKKSVQKLPGVQIHFFFLFFCKFFYMTLSRVFFRNFIERISRSNGKKNKNWLKGSGFCFMESIVNGFSQVFGSKLKGQLYFMICRSHIRLVTLRFKNQSVI